MLAAQPPRIMRRPAKSVMVGDSRSDSVIHSGRPPRTAPLYHRIRPLPGAWYNRWCHYLQSVGVLSHNVKMNCLLTGLHNTNGHVTSMINRRRDAVSGTQVRSILDQTAVPTSSSWCSVVVDFFQRYCNVLRRRRPV